MTKKKMVISTPHKESFDEFMKFIATSQPGLKDFYGFDLGNVSAVSVEPKPGSFTSMSPACENPCCFYHEFELPDGDYGEKQLDTGDKQKFMYYSANVDGVEISSRFCAGCSELMVIEFEVLYPNDENGQWFCANPRCKFHQYAVASGNFLKYVVLHVDAQTYFEHPEQKAVNAKTLTIGRHEFGKVINGKPVVRKLCDGCANMMKLRGDIYGM